MHLRDAASQADKDPESCARGVGIDREKSDGSTEAVGARSTRGHSRDVGCGGRASDRGSEAIPLERQLIGLAVGCSFVDESRAGSGLCRGVGEVG